MAKRGPHDMTHPFPWKAELRSFAIVLGLILGLMDVWWLVSWLRL
jgi:hypothetical protein